MHRTREKKPCFFLIKITKVFQKSAIKGVIKNEIKGIDTRDVIEGRAFVYTRPIVIDKSKNIQYIYIETLSFFFRKNSQERIKISYGDL